MQPKWLDWSQKLQAIAQNGLAFTENPFDVERFEQVRQIAAEMMAIHANIEQTYIQDLFARDVGYATPKIDVRGAVFRDDKILLVQEKFDGLWTLPGGWADIGESPSEAVIKEIFEESGYKTRAVKLLAVYDRIKQGHPPFPHHLYKLFFRCEITGGIPTTSMETDAVEFFAADNIPELSFARVLPQQIQRLFTHYHNPDLPTDFD